MGLIPLDKPSGQLLEDLQRLEHRSSRPHELSNKLVAGFRVQGFRVQG